MLISTLAWAGSEQDFECLAAQATAARITNNLPGPIDLYKQAVQANPKWQEGWWFLGSMLYDSDRYAEARDALSHLWSCSRMREPLGASSVCASLKRRTTATRRPTSPKPGSERQIEPQMEAVALPEDGNFVSGMGLDFRDFNNDGLPDIVFVALQNQTFPLFQNSGSGEFKDVTTTSGLRNQTAHMAGFGAALIDLDNDGWKDLFVTRGHVAANAQPGQDVDQFNTVFRNMGSSGKWKALTEEAGLNASPAARHRGLAFADLDGDGRPDVVATALGKSPEIWMNRSEDTGHWIDVALRGTKSNRDGIGARIKLSSKRGTQYNHMTTSIGYASSSDGPVHFGLGGDATIDSIEITWLSGIVQVLRDVKADQVLAVVENGK
jgi:ASPIC and UnbV/FG-GAP-like repeat